MEVMASKLLTVLVLVTTLTRDVSAPTTQNCNLTAGSISKTATTLSCQVTTLSEKHMFSSYTSLHIESLNVTCTELLSISSIDPNSAIFPGMSELVDLAVVNCKINSLSEATLSQTNSRLKRLTIEGTYLVSTLQTIFENPMYINPNSISQFIELEELSLYNNRLSQPPHGEYCQLTSLKVLNLSANAFNDAGELGFSSSSTGSTCATNLTTLDLSYNNFTVLQNYSFSGLVNLQVLYLRANRIVSVDQNAFFNLDRHLEFLDLSENYNIRISEVNQWEFTQYPNRLRSTFWNLDLGGFNQNGIDISRYLDLFSKFDYRYYDHMDSTIREAENKLIFSGQYVISYKGVSLNENDSIASLHNLIELNLSYNGITELKEDVFSGLIRLKQLVLSRNSLTELTKDIFRGLRDLEYLDLRSNSISEIEDETFSPLTKLRSLDFDLNNLHNLTSGTFRGLVNLKSLQMFFNSIKWIDQDFLSDLPAIETLELNFNSLREIANLGFQPNITTLNLRANDINTIHAQALHGMSNLESIDLSFNSLSSLPDDIFDKFDNLSTLLLMKNNLTVLPHAALQALFRHNTLTELNLSFNHVKTMNFELLPKSLVRLYLNGNDIESIVQYAFTGLVHLEEIELQNNLIRHVTAHWFPTSISIINLEKNQISKIDPDAFHHLNLLKYVVLKTNRLITLDASVMETSSANFSVGENQLICDCNLEWMQAYSGRIVDYNMTTCCEVLGLNGHCIYRRIRELLPDDFRCPLNTYQLDPPNFCITASNRTLCHLTCPAAGCQCYRRYNWTAIITSCSSQNLASVPGNMSSSSTEIRLDGNVIHFLAPSSFDTSYPDLIRLLLNDSQLKTISEWTFETMENLMELHLQQNQLSTLKGDTFGGLKRLKFLWLSANNLLQLDQNIFNPLFSLVELSLRDNSLQQLPDFNLKARPNLTALNIYDNPWNCSCDNFGKYQEYLSAGMFRYTSPDNSIRCRLQGDTIRPMRLFQEYGTTNCSQDSSASQFSDPGSMVLPLASSTSIFVVVIILCAVLFNYRHEIRVLIYSRYGIRFGPRSGSASEGFDDGKLYDAFVAYSTQDRDFVAYELVQRLETGEHPYVLCLHERNFAVGSYIMESILEAVERSRRTIVVMSRHFMESSWCRFEFKSAHHQMLQDQRNRLIMIVLDEDVVDVEAEPNIKIYLKTNTYLARSDKLFWEKLYYAMPDRRGPTK